MSLAGLLLGLVGVTLVFAVLVLTSESLRNDHAAEQTRTTLRSLREALVLYKEHHDAPPSGTTPAVLALLIKDDAVGAKMRGLNMSMSPQGEIGVRDGYGWLVRYVPGDPSRSGLGDFVSSGPDGLFGDPESPRSRARHAAADDVYGLDVEIPDEIPE